MAAFGNRYANVIAKTAAYAFQHRYGKDYIIVISCFPVTFIHPQIFKALVQIVFPLFDNLA